MVPLVCFGDVDSRRGGLGAGSDRGWPVAELNIVRRELSEYFADLGPALKERVWGLQGSSD